MKQIETGVISKKAFAEFCSRIVISFDNYNL